VYVEQASSCNALAAEAASAAAAAFAAACTAQTALTCLTLTELFLQPLTTLSDPSSGAARCQVLSRRDLSELRLCAKPQLLQAVERVNGLHASAEAPAEAPAGQELI